jgi:hypothetical protein
MFAFGKQADLHVGIAVKENKKRQNIGLTKNKKASMHLTYDRLSRHPRTEK